MTDDPLAAVADLPAVFEAVETARGAVDALLRDLRAASLRGRVPEVRAQVLRRSAWASTLLELGSTPASWPLVAFEPPFADDGRGRTASGALRLSAEVASLASTWAHAPAQALARAHVLAASGLVGAQVEGGDVRGRPRPVPGLAERLAALAALARGSTTAPAVVVAAVVHGELLALRPFGSVDGVVARAASRLVLVARGLDPQAVTVPEEGHLVLGTEAYGTALDGYRRGTPDGVAAWVVHCASALALGARVARDVGGVLSGTRPSAQPPSPR